MFPDELVDLRAALEHGQLLLKGLQRGEVLGRNKIPELGAIGQIVI